MECGEFTAACLMNADVPRCIGDSEAFALINLLSSD